MRHSNCGTKRPRSLHKMKDSAKSGTRSVGEACHVLDSMDADGRNKS